ncbi:MAG: Uma2 family endonuclease [Isosphaeraceae bacterium]|nr:Uma2 family endonuclease [Isosphaeraceae bacterium]
MSTAEQPVRILPPPLVEGERLDQGEFHRRYEAMPPGTRAELINGVVSMPSPVGRAHGQAHVPAIVWLDRYAEATPGVEVLDNATTILGRKSEPQPDVLLRILPEYGGRTRTERGFVRGAPELILEVAKATRYIDLGPKLDDYERAGVCEYVVRALDPHEVVWHVLREGHLIAVPQAVDGLYRSEVFPGLWLDPAALLAGDRAGLRAALELGLATIEHAAFIASLAAVRVGIADKE